jgi:hypothetical protein
MIAEHPEIYTPHGAENPAKRGRGRPRGSEIARMAAEFGMSYRNAQRSRRIFRDWPELGDEIKAGRLDLCNAERLVILRRRDPVLLDQVIAGHLSIKDAMSEMKRRNVILLKS